MLRLRFITFVIGATLISSSAFSSANEDNINLEFETVGYKFNLKIKPSEVDGSLTITHHDFKSVGYQIQIHEIQATMPETLSDLARIIKIVVSSIDGHISFWNKRYKFDDSTAIKDLEISRLWMSFKQ